MALVRRARGRLCCYPMPPPCTPVTIPPSWLSTRAWFTGLAGDADPDRADQCLR